jgi:serpin B
MEVLELPYKGDKLVMDFLLPANRTTSLTNFEATLTASILTSTFAKPLEYSANMLLVPKFAFSTSVALAPVLSGLGMPQAFVANQADFSGIDGMQDLYISFVVQDATITVDESGTVASVATGVGVSTASIAEAPTTIDRPFVFLIRDVKSGSILFMGHVTDPRQG